MLDNIIHSNIGLFHTLFALLAMISGTIVLFKIKGTKTHKRLGYVYVFSMLTLNLSSFFIVNFGGFSLFHGLAIFSLITILAAIIPTFLRTENWFYYHFYFMNWSIIGLYCAFIAEVGTRFVKNMQQFWWIVFLAMLLPSIIGGIIIHKKAKKLNLK